MTDTEAAAAQGSQEDAARQAGDQANHAAELNLGPCHYCEHEAVEMGMRDGEAGWIPVCEEHKGKAGEDGFEVREPAAPTTAGTSEGTVEGAEPAGDDSGEEAERAS